MRWQLFVFDPTDSQWEEVSPPVTKPSILMRMMAEVRAKYPNIKFLTRRF